MIAVTFALPAESRDFVRQIRGRKSGAAPAKFLSGRIGQQQIAVLHTGVGGAVSDRRLRTFLDGIHLEFLVAAGFAGATSDKTSVGEIVLSENFSDATLLAWAQKALSAKEPRVGNLFTANEMIDSTMERAQIEKRENALAIDMETSTIAQICRARGLPLLALRVISDTPGKPFPLPPGVLFDLPRQRTVARRLVSYLVAHPSGSLRLIKFSRQIALARRSLTEALGLLLQTRA